MDRRTPAVVCAAAIGLFLLGTPAVAGDATKGDAPRRGAAPPEKKGTYRLGEVKILGSVEHPAVLFFLPRAKFRLLPSRAGQDWTERLLRDDRDKGDLP